MSCMPHMPHGAGILLAISVATVVVVVVAGLTGYLTLFVGHSLYGALHFYCRIAFGCLIN